MLGFWVDSFKTSFDPLLALGVFGLLKGRLAGQTRPSLPFPDDHAYTSNHSFIDQYHAAETTLWFFKQLEYSDAFHEMEIDIAASEDALSWRDLWAAVCFSLYCKPRTSQTIRPTYERPAVPMMYEEQSTRARASGKGYSAIDQGTRWPSPPPALMRTSSDDTTR
jgi:hypothetical protein